MKLIYPYNEILPKKKAHDAFIFHECTAFAKAGYEVILVCGKGSAPNLFEHYQTKEKNFSIHTLPMVRKNFGPWSWNFPFFFFTNQFLKKEKPDLVILSVLKQGIYHLKRKLPSTTYIYEVHELQFYPNSPFDPKKVEEERAMLQLCDHIVVTTHELKKILTAPPYSLKNKIHVIPLASDITPLPPLSFSPPLHLAYVGQLYKEQGVEFLLKALAPSNAHLSIIGGKPLEIEALKKQAAGLNIADRVHFLGFHPPQKLPSLLTHIHAFVAPFEAGGKMPYVAHTKLIEYIHWGRPIIAPNLPVVKECFPNNEGVIYFDPSSFTSLTKAISNVKNFNTTFSPFFWSSRIDYYTKLLTIN